MKLTLYSTKTEVKVTFEDRKHSRMNALSTKILYMYSEAKRIQKLIVTSRLPESQPSVKYSQKKKTKFIAFFEIPLVTSIRMVSTQMGNKL